MSVSAITRLGRMGRWEPDARGRMVAAAMELFAERGYDRTTAGEIAERAGVTERTFFRHFPDKREVLFDSTHTMDRLAVDAIDRAPADLGPFEVALRGVTAGAGMLDGRHGHAVRRAAIIASEPSLRERELLKLAAMTEATADALRGRGVADPAAGLAAHSAVTVFHLAFARWIADEDPPAIGEVMAETAAALRALT